MYNTNIFCWDYIDIKSSLIEETLQKIDLGNNSELHLISPDGRDIAARIENDESQLIDTAESQNRITNQDFYSKIITNEVGDSLDRKSVV